MTQSGLILLLLSGLFFQPVMAAPSPVNNRVEATSVKKSTQSGGNNWIQDRCTAEKAMHMPDSSGSVYLAAKLSTKSDFGNARALLRKSAEKLKAAEPPAQKTMMHQDIAALVGDFAFLQSAETADSKKKSATDDSAVKLEHLKQVSGDYEILLAAVRKHLGANDPQVQSLVQVQEAFKRALEEREETETSLRSRVLKQRLP